VCIFFWLALLLLQVRTVTIAVPGALEEAAVESWIQNLLWEQQLDDKPCVRSPCIAHYMCILDVHSWKHT
tara:strand:- start:260 stop:469 length:210 start_codon:yes stop_codon:yes gene_type:complete